MACVVFKLIYLHDYHSVLLESLHVGRKERSNSSDLSVIFPPFFFSCVLSAAYRMTAQSSRNYSA